MLKKILSPIQNYRTRSKLAIIEKFAKKMKKKHTHFLFASKEQKEKKKMADWILSQVMRAKQGKEWNIKIVEELLKEFDKEGKKLAAKLQ